ncbi:hypothetical protein PIB30_054854 [Stylosanthes scabra]|uniref:Uncharacterized protein n=1 Tax=Stylosanthes scabra TaxID=79078 RepID=A0ABU6TIQ7_9FABA|nr:hypothetical protein [Stylosanthes scabra]
MKRSHPNLNHPLLYKQGATPPQVLFSHHIDHLFRNQLSDSSECFPSEGTLSLPHSHCLLPLTIKVHWIIVRYGATTLNESQGGSQSNSNLTPIILLTNLPFSISKPQNPIKRQTHTSFSYGFSLRFHKT